MGGHALGVAEDVDDCERRRAVVKVGEECTGPWLSSLEGGYTVREEVPQRVELARLGDSRANTDADRQPRQVRLPS